MEKIALLPEVDRECYPEANVRRLEKAGYGSSLLKLLIAVCIGVFIAAAALFILQSSAEIYRLNRRVDILEQEIEAIVSSPGHQSMQGVVQSPSVWRNGLGDMHRPLPSSDQGDTKLTDASETSAESDDNSITNDISDEKSVASSTDVRRRTKRSSKQSNLDPSQISSGRHRRSVGRNQRSTTTPATQSGHGDHHRRHRHNEVAAYQLTMDMQLQVRETVNVTHGEYGPHGFRPKKDDMSQSYPYKMWKAAEWAQNNNQIRYDSETGQIVVAKKGIYYIYAQLLYCNAAARSSYSVMSSSDTKPQELARCWSSVGIVGGPQIPTNETATPRFKTCHVSVTAMLNANERVWLEDRYGNYIKPDANANIFGIIRLLEHS